MWTHLLLLLPTAHYPRTHKHGPNCTVDTQERDCGVELVCLPPQDSTTYHFCGECTTHEQCTARPELMCRVEFNGRRLCVHKDMWPPDGRDWWGFALAFLACAISAGAGIGGGGLLVPLFMLLLMVFCFASVIFEIEFDADVQRCVELWRVAGVSTRFIKAVPSSRKANPGLLLVC